MWPKIHRVRVTNFRASGSILTKLFHATCCEAGVITWVQFLEGRPKKIGSAKNCPKFGAISGTRLWVKLASSLLTKAKAPKQRYMHGDENTDTYCKQIVNEGVLEIFVKFYHVVRQKILHINHIRITLMKRNANGQPYIVTNLLNEVHDLCKVCLSTCEPGISIPIDGICKKTKTTL